MCRPAIPAEMKRAVLIEAGHRCAIPQCAEIPVDVHHIVPWENCKEHSPDNLITLCPNCHRRAHDGTIDRKSLQQYKLIGQRRLLGIPAELPAAAPWDMVDYRESSGEEWKYEVEIGYPQFRRTDNQWAEEVNAIIKGAAFEQVEGIRNIANEAPWTLVRPAEEGFSSYSASSEVLMFRNNLLSIRISIATFYYGAAHGQRTSRCLNFYLNPVHQIRLRHLLPNGGADEKLVSTAVREHFCAAGFAPDDWQLMYGTDPVRQNFNKFNLLDNGVLFTFDEYEVGPYSAGRQQVIVPYRRLNEDLPPEIGDDTQQ